MGGVLSVENDRLKDFEVVEANIFTIGQGFCLQRLEPENSEVFRFDHGLAYGSWYDIQIIGQFLNNDDDNLQKYLTKGIYLRHGRTILISELTRDENRDRGAKWVCGSCSKENTGSVAVCEYCETNKSHTIIKTLSCVPLLGVPFSVTDAVLQCGKASQSNKTSDNIDAGLTVAFAVIDIITAPFIVGALAKVPGKVAAKMGTEITAKTFFMEAGKPILKESGKVFGKDGIIILVKTGKAVVRKIASNSN